MLHISTHTFLLSGKEKKLQYCCSSEIEFMRASVNAFVSMFFTVWAVHTVSYAHPLLGITRLSCRKTTESLRAHRQDMTSLNQQIHSLSRQCRVSANIGQPCRKGKWVYYSNSPKYLHPVSFFCCFVRLANNGEAYPNTHCVNCYWGWVIVDWSYSEIVWMFSSHLHSCAPLLRIRSLKEQKRHTVLSAQGTEAALPFAK